VRSIAFPELQTKAKGNKMYESQTVIKIKNGERNEIRAKAVEYILEKVLYIIK